MQGFVQTRIVPALELVMLGRVGKHLVTALGLLLFASATHADTHYVDLNCKTSRAPYTSWNTAAANIMDAVRKAEDGDTVLVANGSYKIDASIRLSKALTVRSVNGRGVTTVDAGGKCRVVSIHAENGPVTLQGFTISGGFADKNGDVGGGIHAIGKGPVLITDCMIQDNEAGKFGGGINAHSYGGLTVNAIISHCIIRRNRAGITGGGIHAATWGNPEDSSLTIENCVVYNNSAEQKGGGIGNHNPDGPVEKIKVINCTVTGNFADSWGNGGGLMGVSVYNSIVFGNKSSANEHDIGSGCKVHHSCSPEISGGSSGNIRKKPFFVNAAEGDFRLLPDSPCIDAGSNAYTNSDLDIEGNSRVADGRRDGNAVVDMGAYELQLLQIDIDIKPDSKNDSVNLEARGRLPVAILSTDSFEVSSVDVSTIRFAGAKPVLYTFRDVDDDGDADLVLEFERKNLKLDPDCTQVRLIGDSTDGVPFVTVSEIAVVRE